MSANEYYQGGAPQQPPNAYPPPNQYEAGRNYGPGPGPDQGYYNQPGQPPMQYQQPPMQYQQQPMQYQQQPPPPQQSSGGGNKNCLVACLATICFCCAIEECCECWEVEERR
ncbi:hypothetical protein NLU13_9212 [Sarocladium strictum]|uniref:Cysteine-rich transmembrane CYSTM domain-containing protein n=1 Tax=Sarocladium strictum TaxID=5046 RepID=A0AA39L478_SARSR|nr:hypothetical protein NLU13_9212 [Sarocladium strictum]